MEIKKEMKIIKKVMIVKKGESTIVIKLRGAETREREVKAKTGAWNGMEKNRTSVEKLLSTRVISFAKLSNFKVLPRKPWLVNKKRLGTGKTSPWWTAPSTLFRIFNPKLNYKASFLYRWIISVRCIREKFWTKIYLISFPLFLIFIFKCRKNYLYFAFVFIYIKEKG